MMQRPALAERPGVVGVARTCIARRRGLGVGLPTVIVAGVVGVVLVSPVSDQLLGRGAPAVCSGHALTPSQAREAEAYAAVLRGIPAAVLAGPVYLDRSLARAAGTAEQARSPMPTAIVDCLLTSSPGWSPRSAVEGIDDPRLPRAVRCSEVQFGCMGHSGRGAITGGVLVSLSRAPAESEGDVTWTVVNGIGGSFATVHLVRRGATWHLTNLDAQPGTIN